MTLFGSGMVKSRERFSRWWLALSLAIKFGLGACLALTLIGGPERSAALTTPPQPQTVEVDSSVELVQMRKKQRLTRRERARRAAQEKERAAAEAKEKAEQRERERAEAEAREKAAREEQARLEAEQREKAAREERERAEVEQQARQRRGKAATKQKEAPSERAGRGTPVPPIDRRIPTPDAGKAVETGQTAAPGKASPGSGEQAPAQATAEPEKPATWTDAEIIDALRECVRLLGPIAAHVDVSPPIRSGECGAPAPVAVRRVGASTPVEISPPAVVNCRMVAKLHEWVEGTLQPAARDAFNAPVRRLVNASGYVCRNRYGSSIDKISEHAFANAIDISAFVMADGRSVDVLGNWGKTERDLRAIAIAKAEAEKAKAEAERQAKAAAAAEKAAAKAKGQDTVKAAKSATDAGKALAEVAKSDEPDKSEHPATKQQLKMRDGPGAKQQGGKERDRDVLEDRIPLPGQARDAQTKRALASNDRNALGVDPRTLRDVAVEAPAITKEGAFLRRLHKGACGIFGTVLGPEANDAHRNHFHLDLASRRRSAFCE